MSRRRPLGIPAIIAAGIRRAEKERRACGHVALVSVTQGQRVERYDRCGHPSGPHPMHEGCPWMVAKTQGAAI